MQACSVEEPYRSLGVRDREQLPVAAERNRGSRAEALQPTDARLRIANVPEPEPVLRGDREGLAVRSEGDRSRRFGCELRHRARPDVPDADSVPACNRKHSAGGVEGDARPREVETGRERRAELSPGCNVPNDGAAARPGGEELAVATEREIRDFVGGQLPDRAPPVEIPEAHDAL